MASPVRVSVQVLLRIGGRMLYAGADAEASGPGNGAEAPSPQPKGDHSEIFAGSSGHRTRVSRPPAEVIAL